MSISMTSFSVVSLIAMVPDRECRTPTLMVSCADRDVVPASAATAASAPTALLMCLNFFIIRLSSPRDLGCRAAAERSQALCQGKEHVTGLGAGMAVWTSECTRSRQMIVLCLIRVQNVS
jgi:hypothetical protein